MAANPPKKGEKSHFSEEQIRQRAYEIWKSGNGTGNTEDDWSAAIQSLELEHSKLRRIRYFLWRLLASPYRSTQKFLNLFASPDDRGFALDVVKTIISSLSLTATVIAAIGLFITYQNAQKQQSLSSERLITDRFSKAVEQLGSEKLEVRLGGIYSLERISKDSQKDYWTVMEVLTAFVRERSSSNKKQTTPKKVEGTSKQTKEKKQASAPTTDIQAVLTVLTRRDKSYQHGEKHRLRLSGANLSGANLSGANLSNENLHDLMTLLHSGGKNLRYSNFSRADLSDADLSGAKIFYSNFSRADLSDADLSGAELWVTNFILADLSNADLSGVNLWRANLSGAHLFYANLSNARITGADLSGAHLFYANLSDANLSNAYLGGADLSNAYLGGADLSDANLEAAKFWDKNRGEAKNITPEQIKKAKNWDKAIYSPEFRKKLGLPPAD